MAEYLIESAPMQTTAAAASLSTGTAIKTLLQLKPGATNSVKIKEWGVSFDGSTAATPIKVELIETDVAATVTASVANDITKVDSDALNSGDPTTSNLSVGTTATGYNASAEGTITTVRKLDSAKFIAPTNQYDKQFPLGDEPVLQPSKFTRIRVTAGTAVNAYAYIKVVV